MDDIIRLDNKDYLITDEIIYNERNYLYVVSLENCNNFTVLEDNDGFVASVTDKNVLKEVLNLMSKKL